MSAYQKLQDFMAGLEQRKAQLWSRELEITQALTTQEAALDEAFITGDHQAVQEQIANLKTELANVQRERQAVTNPPRDGILGKLVKEVWQEATDHITGDLRREWEAELTELEKARTVYLAVVAELGSIKRRADSISSRATEVMLTWPGLKKIVPSLSTGLIMRPDRKEGPIYLNPQIIEKTFLGRK